MTSVEVEGTVHWYKTPEGRFYGVVSSAEGHGVCEECGVVGGGHALRTIVLTDHPDPWGVIAAGCELGELSITCPSCSEAQDLADLAEMGEGPPAPEPDEDFVPPTDGEVEVETIRKECLIFAYDPAVDWETFADWMMEQRGYRYTAQIEDDGKTRVYFVDGEPVRIDRQDDGTAHVWWRDMYATQTADELRARSV